MSEYQSDASSFETTRASTQAEITLQLSPNGNIFVDWSQLPRPNNVRHCVIHYKSLNNNRSHTIRVSRKKRRGYLKKIHAGHLYEVHVCSVDSADRIIASSQRAQIQTIASNEAPRLRVTKSTPDFIWLEWDKPDGVDPADIRTYKVVINGQTQAILPAEEKKYVVSDGQLGERYTYQVEMVRNDGKAVSSIPVHVLWPTVTVPKTHAIVNGAEELIICWEDSVSINDGNIESYTLHLYDSEENFLTSIGPNSAECRQVWVKDVLKGIYFYVLETKLANSNQSVLSKPMQIECGNESRLPVLTCSYMDSSHEKELINMAYHLISVRDNMTSKRLLDRCEHQLQQILSLLTHLTDSIRINLMIESKSSRTILQTYRLLIDDEESKITMPGTTKQFPLQLPRREKPYELAVLVTPDLYGTQSKKVLVEASGELTFFCAHFDQSRAVESCAYTVTFPREKQLKQAIHQGLLKVPQTMNNIEIYDLRENKKVQLPPLGKTRRLSILLFYVDHCVPSTAHLNYFATYASTHRAQYNYMSINCTQTDIDGLKESTKDFTDIQCYTEFSAEDFEYVHKDNDQPLHEILSLAGVPMYIILDFSSRIVWKGRLCVQTQPEYDVHMDHIIAEVNKIPCSSGKCELCQYCALNEEGTRADLNEIELKLQFLIQQRFSPTAKKNQEGDKENRRRRVVSMKDMSNKTKNIKHH